MAAAARIVNIAKAKIAVLRNRLMTREYTSPPDYAVCCETGGAKNERSPDIAYSRRVAALRPPLRPQCRNVSRRFPEPPAMRQLCPQYPSPAARCLPRSRPRRGFVHKFIPSQAKRRAYQE